MADVKEDAHSDAHWYFFGSTSKEERDAISELFTGRPGDHLTHEEATRRVALHQLPKGLTTRVLDAYDRLAEAMIRKGKPGRQIEVLGTT